LIFDLIFEETDMREFACDGPINTIIRTSSGNVDVIAEERSSVTVDVTPATASETSRAAAAQTRVEMNGDLLIVETPQLRGLVTRRSGSVNIRVHLPTNSRIQFSSSSADLRCAGRVGDLEISTSSGDARIDYVAGDMRRNSASGDTQFNRIDGDLSVHSASGDVRGGTVGGGLTSRSASGDVRIDAVGGSVKAQSASGDIEIDSLWSGVTRVNSASGDVQLGVAEGVSVWLDLTSISGDTRSELPVSESAPAGRAATLNLHVRTVSGDVKIRRSTNAAANGAFSANGAADVPTVSAA
jgi:DUF4097 and DUF4098 domain-containing protein YvlB